MINSIKVGTGSKIMPGLDYEGEVVIGKNTIIGRNVSIYGKITIGENCKIGHHIEITGEGYIGDGTEIRHDIHNPKIGARCIVKGEVIDSVLENDCVIGENAQIKRCRLEIGVKIKHYAGVRDADIGDYTNISEGVTIANYDGVVKKKTKIGAYVMIGVHARIIGGVTIGDECFIADGARVDKNLPSQTYFNSEKALKYPAFRAVRDNCAWYLYGNYLVLEKAVGEKYRAVFVNRLIRNHNGNVDEIKKWLKTPMQEFGGRTPIQCIKEDGCEAIEKLLPDNAKKQEADRKAEAVRKLIEAAKDRVQNPEKWINKEIPTGPLYEKTPKELVEIFGEKLIPVLLKFAKNEAMI